MPPRHAEWGDSPTIDALQAMGAQRLDPVRFAYAQALASRAAAQGEAVQAVLQPRLQQALADLSAVVESAGVSEQPQPGASSPHASIRAASPLGELLARLNRPASGTASGTAATMAGGAPTELRALSQHRSTWASLAVKQQLNRSLAQAPENTGPLNSQRLVLRALQQLQALSPAYLQRFMAHVDALVWLEQHHAALAAPPSPPPRRERKVKPGPARTRAR